ncbi:virion structural protein [Xanthomonas phage XaC1]|nr:virion structural protein [Xanthomonas phage XaC1]
MANFDPKWDITLDSTVIQEGQNTFCRLKLSKADESVSNNYYLDTDQYLEISFDIKLQGATVLERDYTVSVGESTSTLVPIANANTGTTKINGTHIVKLNKKNFQLTGTNIDAYLIKITCPDDGIWDDDQSIAITLNYVKVNKVQDDVVTSITDSGIIGVSTLTLIYDSSNDVWVTPDLITHGDQLFTIGAIDFGAESRLFVQAYGKSVYDSSISASRVFVPSYQLLDMTEAEMPKKHITGSGTISTRQNVPNAVTNEEVLMYLKDGNGAMVNSGLRFNNNNGQFVQILQYDSEPVDLYFKVRISSIDLYYNYDTDAYYEGKRFRAYALFVAPQDVSGFDNPPIPGHLYQLKNTKVYPYVVKTTTVDGKEYLKFESEYWLDMGLYDSTLGEGILGKTKIFRIVLNNNYGSTISFDTEPNLGTVHVGEYFGHTKYPKIIASGSDLITYTLSSASVDDITKYNLGLSADGFITGTAYCKGADFNSNDELPLSFIVTATAKDGSSVSQEFKLTIVRGFGENYISSYLQPTSALERSYFQCISSNTFNKFKYYRESDSRFGRQRVPNILLKENFVNPNGNFTDIKTAKSELRSKIIDTVNGALIPDSTFRYVIGNYKVITAVDNDGNELYDVLYRELLPFGSTPKKELDPRVYNSTDYFDLSEVYGLRQNIYNVLGEDTKNLVNDPDDFENRAISVPELDSISISMVDTVPRFMNHTQGTSGIKDGYRPVMVVAYLQPGEGDNLFSALVGADENSVMLGTVVEVQYVKFKYFSEENGKYVEQSFAIPIPVRSLMA